MTRLLEKFRNRLDISRRGLTYVIAISFTSNNAERAAHYANAIAEAFVASQAPRPHRGDGKARRLAQGPAEGIEQAPARIGRCRCRLQVRAQDPQCRQGFHDPAIAGDRNQSAGLPPLARVPRKPRRVTSRCSAILQGQCRRSGEAGPPERAARAALDPERSDRAEESGVRRPPSRPRDLLQPAG